MPVESEPAVAEIHFHKIRLTVKGKSTRVYIFLSISSFHLLNLQNSKRNKCPSTPLLIAVSYFQTKKGILPL